MIEAERVLKERNISERRERSGGTWRLCGQLPPWECHRQGQLLGDSLTQPAAGDTQPAAFSGQIMGVEWRNYTDHWTCLTLIGRPLMPGLVGEGRGDLGFVLIPFVIVQAIMVGMAGCHHPTS